MRLKKWRYVPSKHQSISRQKNHSNDSPEPDTLPHDQCHTLSDLKTRIAKFPNQPGQVTTQPSVLYTSTKVHVVTNSISIFRRKLKASTDSTCQGRHDEQIFANSIHGNLLPWLQKLGQAMFQPILGIPSKWATGRVPSSTSNSTKLHGRFRT